MLLLFLTVIYSCIVYVGQKPTRACLVLLFKVALYKDFFPPIFHLKTAVTFLIVHQN